MVIVMLISLYTSRVVLKALGVDDFGLYNVIGGVVGLFTFLRTSMEKATQRFLNVEMAKPNGQIKNVFSVSLSIHLFISILIFILAETLGLWFLNAKVNIPMGREIAANWVYQATVLSLCITVISVPFSASIIAHEKMSFFAIVSIVDAVLKLAIAICALLYDKDKLILYGSLMALISVVSLLMYGTYSMLHYEEVSLKLCYDRERFKEIFSFVGWTILGQFAIVGTNQGNTILLNMFHSVAANAAMSVGAQVNNAITSLSSSFQTAFNPQITKSYAENNYNYLKSLVFITSKISFCLLLLVSIPIIFNIDLVLNLWLDTVPQMSSIFCILFIINGILNALSAPLNFCVMASGKIKLFQITTSVVYLSDLVVLYFLFSIGFPPETVMWVKVSIMLIIIFVRLGFAHQSVDCINIRSYILGVLFPLILTSLVSVLGGFLFSHLANGNYVILQSVAMIIWTGLSVLFIALKPSERKTLLSLVRNKVLAC